MDVICFYIRWLWIERYCRIDPEGKSMIYVFEIMILNVWIWWLSNLDKNDGNK